MLIALISMAFPTWAGSASERPDQKRFDLEQYVSVPGVQIIKTGKGEDEKLELRKGGVSITQWRQNQEIQTLGVDESGHGAVLCTQGIYIQLRLALDVCYPEKYQDLRTELDHDLDSLDTFIAANSLPPTSKSQVDNGVREEAMRAKKATLSMPPAELEKRCHSKELSDFIGPFLRSKKTERDKELANLLSVPRPPVLNPCL